MLNELQEPYREVSVSFAELPSGEFDKAEPGKILLLLDPETGEKIKTFVVNVSRNYEDVTQSSLTIANKPQDIAQSIADLADRQRIEMAYSQGATQIYADSTADNADAQSPVELRFYIADTMKIVNAVKCKIRLSQFRAYSKATASGGNISTGTSSSSQSSSGGGGSVSTASGGGGGAYTSSGGGGSTSVGGGGIVSSGSTGIDFSRWGRLDLSGITTTGANGPGWHTHKSGYTYIDFSGVRLPSDHTHTVNTQFHINLPSHTHSISLQSHSHSISIPSHSHSIAHTHTVNTQHDHAITPIIALFGGASGFTLLVNGVPRGHFNATDVEVDITQYLIKNGTIPRGVWHTVGVKPDGLARAEISYNVQGFIQSRGDATL